jgi:hypothetical protein
MQLNFAPHRLLSNPSVVFSCSPNPYSDKGQKMNNKFEDDSDLDEVEDAGAEKVDAGAIVTEPIVFSSEDCGTAAAPIAPTSKLLSPMQPAAAAPGASCLLEASNSAFGISGMGSTITPNYAANTPMGQMQEMMKLINQQGSRLLELQSERREMIKMQKDQDAIVEQSFKSLQQEMAFQQNNLSMAAGVMPTPQQSMVAVGGNAAW